MIAVRLMGGLGNQMFEYATAKSLALTHNTHLVLDLSHYENQPENEVPRSYELDCFRIKAKTSTEPIEKIVGKRSGFRKLIPTNPNLVLEKAFYFNREVLEAPNNSLLVGYWQSEKYFDNHIVELRKDFTFKNPLSPAKQKVAQEIASKDHPVSLQVRRGDFVSHHGSSNFHGALGLDYYDNAVKEIAKTVTGPHFFVISDDPEWCRENIKLDYPTTFVDHIPGTGHEDMNLMSRCEHHIIANSTFSWWGAWLNPNPNKIVIAPVQWFKDPAMKGQDKDVVPGSWIRV